jgi:RPA family protein
MATPRQFKQKVDFNGDPVPIIPLNDPQSVTGTLVSAQSVAINGTAVRIVASTGPLYFLIGANPVASAVTGHYLADQQEIYQNCNVGDIVAIFGGIAQISTCGV